MSQFLTRYIAYAPPDELGGADAPTETPDNDAGGAAAVVPEKEAPVAEPKSESISQSIRRAIAETKDKAIKPPKSAITKTEGADTGDTVVKDSKTTPEGNTETAPQGKTGAPQAWKAEEKAIWDSLPDVAKAAVTRREADTAKGVQELRTRYQDIDAAIAPYSAVIRQANVTPAQAIAKMFAWNTELAGPNKVMAARQLLTSFGIDPATLAVAPTHQGAPGASGEVPDTIRPIIDGLEARIRGFETTAAASAQLAAQQTWNGWAKDKPHVEQVRQLMANLVQSDLALMQAGMPQVSNTIKDGNIDFDAAYNAAIYAHPEVRQVVLKEEQKKRDAEAKAAAERARKAGSGLRSGAPAGTYTNGADNAARVETPRESIRRAMAELRGA